jgi:hypothetical protein
MGNSPDALADMRRQVEAELAGGREIVARAEAQLGALDQLEALLAEREPDEPPAFVPGAAPSLKKAILLVLDTDPNRIWHREALLAELVRRGWGPGGRNPRNTLTSRLRDLENDKQVRRIGQHGFQSLKGVEND